MNVVEKDCLEVIGKARQYKEEYKEEWGKGTWGKTVNKREDNLGEDTKKTNWDENLSYTLS